MPFRPRQRRLRQTGRRSAAPHAPPTPVRAQSPKSSARGQKAAGAAREGAGRYRRRECGEAKPSVNHALADAKSLMAFITQLDCGMRNADCGIKRKSGARSQKEYRIQNSE